MMMRKSISILSALLLLGLFAKAQSSIATVLQSIEKNNRTILKQSQDLNARKLAFRAEMPLNNPKVDYDYLNGSPANAGNQTDFVVTQPFDFPTAYLKKKQLNEEQNLQVDLEFVLSKQEVLLEAKWLMIELVFKHKIENMLESRMQNAKKWLGDFELKLSTGDGNILDVNRAKLDLIDLSTKLAQNSSEIVQLKQSLIELNGGEFIEFTDSVYLETPLIPDADALELEIEVLDPMRKVLEQKRITGLKNVEFYKAMALPKIETGYHYQAILGQTFSGLHLGFTIPLWENSSKIRALRANQITNDLSIDEHRVEHSSEIKQLHEKQNNLKSILLQYEEVFDSVNSTLLLDQALKMGEISSIEYYLELSYSFNAINNYLNAEKDYHRTIAELYRFQL